MAGAIWPLIVIPFMMLNQLNYHEISHSSLPAIIILIVAGLGVLPFGFGLYTFIRRSRAHTVALLFSVIISVITYGLYSAVFAYYILFSYGSF